MHDRKTDNGPAAQPDAQTIEHFRAFGWMRVSAFSADAGLLMRESVWQALSAIGIQRDRPDTWTQERPSHLQHLKTDPVFEAVGSPCLFAAIDAIFDGQSYQRPKDWGAFFIAFPTAQKWCVPDSGWHIDANYVSSLWPVKGIKTFALFGDVAHRGGGTLILSGSHRLVNNWFDNNPSPVGARSSDMRKLLRSHPYVADLHRSGRLDDRLARFVDRTEMVNDIPLRVVEMTGAAGDVFLLHPLVLHVAAPNNTPDPRFLLSGGITTDLWGWASSAKTSPGSR